MLAPTAQSHAYGYDVPAVAASTLMAVSDGLQSGSGARPRSDGCDGKRLRPCELLNDDWRDGCGSGGRCGFDSASRFDADRSTLRSSS